MVSDESFSPIYNIYLELTGFSGEALVKARARFDVLLASYPKIGEFQVNISCKDGINIVTKVKYPKTGHIRSPPINIRCFQS